MAFTIGSGTFTNGSATVTGVTLTSGTLAYFASGTRMVVGVNPVVQEVEAIAAPTVTTITLRSAWTGTGGTYSFLANQTSEGLRDAVQAIRTNNVSLQSFIDSIDTAATANSVAQRTSDGSINAVNVYASGNVGVGTSSPSNLLDIKKDSPAITQSSSSAAYYTVIGTNVDFLESFSIDNKGSKIITYGDDTSKGLGLSGGAGNLIRFTTNSAERLRIDSSGNVGIGVTNPSTFDSANAGGNLVVGTGSGSEGITVFSGTGGAGVLCFADGASSTTTYEGYVQYDHDSNSMRFATSTTERMRIDSSGNVAIGTTSPLFSSRLTAETGSFSAAVLVTSTSTEYSAIAWNKATSGDNGFFLFSTEDSGSVRGSITYNRGSGVVAYNTTSDYRAKDINGSVENALGIVSQLKPYMGTMKGATVERPMFIAHEAQEITPYAVVGEKDAVRTEQYLISPAVYEDVVIPAEFDEEGNEISQERTEQKLVKEAVMGEREVPQYQQMDHSTLVPLLTAALQEAVAKIEALEARIEALEG